MHPDEESFVPKKIQEIMQSIGNVIKYVPMVAEIEATETTWADKRECNL